MSSDGPTTPEEFGWQSLDQDSRFPNWANWSGAVLLDNEIRRYCLDPKYPLIKPFEPKNLKPARYQLTLGTEARINGKTREISKDKPLVIMPHQVAIVRTFEELNIPRFLIARWNLRVDMVYRGLLWVGALQVDPGWVGYLPCPLYNMSDKPVLLYLGEKVFTVDFVRTTPYLASECTPYGRFAFPNPELRTYDLHSLRSGPYDALQRLKGVRRGIQDLRHSFNTMTAGLWSAFGALVAALSIIAIQPGSDKGIVTRFPTLSLIVSGIALVLSLAALNTRFDKVARDRDDRSS